jgi:hypothetical protein
VGRGFEASFLKFGRDAAKIRGEMPHLNNSKSLWKKINTYISQY